MVMKLEMTAQQELNIQELSIRDLFEDFFKIKYPELNFELNDKFSLCENIKFLCLKDEKQFAGKTNEALQYAYDIKYGNWEEVNDLRKLYKDKWHEPVSRYFFKDIDSSKAIIDIGCNDGRELKDILGKNFGKPKITLVDISKKAINNLRQTFEHKNIDVINKSFFDCNIEENSFDYCISLRTLHSSGIDTTSSVEKCYRITKPDGFILLSVSNGYIDTVSEQPIKGMYDPSTRTIDENKPFQIAENIKVKLNSLGAKSVNVLDADSEIFIIGYKNDN